MPESFIEFVHMGGYAFYVWSSYGVALVVVVANVVWPWLRHRQLRRRIVDEEYDD